MSTGVSKEVSEKRQSCVVDLVKNQGLTYRQTGELCGGISRQAVHQRLKSKSLGCLKRQEILRRYASIAFLHKIGERQMDIAKEVGLAQARVSQIIKVYKMRGVRRVYQNI